jgi:GNAT superfamily N-acetyltransferase
MSHSRSRIYEDAKDFQTILDLVARIRPTRHLNDYPTKTDIEENLASAATRANTRLWFDNNQLIAWAYVDEFNNLRWELDRQYEEFIGDEIVKWGESCIRNTLSTGEAGALDASCSEDYQERISFLRKHGFHQTQDITVIMARDLSQPIPKARLPQGFIIRSMTGKQEAKAVAAMHRAAFGTDYMTTENRLAIMNTSGYDLSLDLIAIASDGTIVANCICSVDAKEKVGKTDPVATHPHFQHRGLARALLLTGLRLLKERGMMSAHLGTRGDNLAMQKTAEAVGFAIESKTIWFSKKVN